MDRFRNRGPRSGSALMRAVSSAPRRKFRLPTPRRLRPTRAGWCFLAIILGVGLAALNTGNNLLYLVLSGMLGFLVLSGMLSEGSLRGLRVERLRPGEIHAAQDTQLILRVRNEQARIAAYAITLEDRMESDGDEVVVGRAFALRIGPGAHLDRRIRWCPMSRGEQRFVGVRVSTRFPFGLFVKSMDVELTMRVMVYPALVLNDATPTPLRGRPSCGPESDRPRASGESLIGLRELVPGDRVQRIQWRQSLRRGQLLVGERAAEDADEIEIRLELAPLLTDEAREEAIARATGKIVSALERGARVGLRTAKRWIAPDAGPRHRRHLLETLATLDVDANIEAERIASPSCGLIEAASLQRGATG
jgi:uncharacterized protein (DUF58 family)